METKTLIATKNPEYFIVKFKPTVTTSDTETVIAMFEDKLIDSSIKKLIDDSKLAVKLDSTLR